MSSFLLAAMLVASPSCSPTATSPAVTLIIQAVDQLWLPIPDAAVSVKRSAGSVRTFESTTGKHGFACLELSEEGVYSIQVKRNGFHTARMDAIEINPSPYLPHYVQVPLRVRVIE